MKVLIAHPGPHFSVSDVFDGLVKGLRANGADVGVFNLHDRLNFYSAAHIRKGDEWVPGLSPEDAVRLAAKGLEAVLYEWWPDVVVIVSGFFVPPELWGVLRRRPHHVVYWCTESPYEDDRQANPARHADTVILNDPLNLEWFRTEVNPRTYYMAHSYDPARHHPGRPDPDVECDFAFVGTAFQSRVDFFEQVDWSDLNVKLGGNWALLADDSPLRPFLVDAPDHCLDNADAARLYRSAKVTANLYRKETSEGGQSDGWAIGPREVELAACQSFFMREPRPEGDALFPMLPTFTTPAEFQDQLRWWLAHPKERQIAAAAARVVVSDRTFDATAARLLRLIDGVVKVAA